MLRLMIVYMSEGFQFVEVMSAWLLLGFLLTAYVGVYMFFSGTLSKTLKEGHVELSAVISKVKHKIESLPVPRRIGKSNEDTLNT